MYAADSADSDRGLGPLMRVREFSASEFIHGLFISKKLFINKITALSDRAKDLPTRNEDGSPAPWCQFLAALTWWDVSWRHQVLEHCIHVDQICLLSRAGFGAQKESRNTAGPKLREKQSSKIPSSFCVNQTWLWQRKTPLSLRAFSDPLKVII